MKKYKVLKRIRVVISLFFLILLSIFFLDFTGGINTDLIQGVVFLQFVPSLLKFFNVFSWVATGFIVVLILTLLFGRVYCSTICPLGILQDVVNYIKRRSVRRQKFRYLKAMRWLRYGILVVSVAFLAGGSILVLSLFDPYSTFGRIFSDLFRPLVTEGNNLLASLLSQHGIYTLYQVELKSIHAGVMATPIAFLIVVVWMSITQGRLYCNTICPVGTFLGLISKVSVFQIRLNPTTCTKCGICEKKCKAGCIETKTMKVDFARCVGCFNCLAVCPFSAAEYSLNDVYKPANLKTNPGNTPRGSHTSRGNNKSGAVNSGSTRGKKHPSGKSPTASKPEADNQTAADTQGPFRGKTHENGDTIQQASHESPGKGQPAASRRTDLGKRKFLAGIAVAFASITQLGKAQELVSYSATKPVKRDNPVSPPGAQSTERFNQACTACHLCINACPTHVLQPALLEYGLRGLMQPRMDYHASFCNYDCVACGEVCPTGAILPLALKDKKRIQLGKAHFVKENCIVETEGTDCGSCSEHCPTKAVHMVDYKNDLRIPEVDQDICIGCGACEYACPTHPYKAIYVEGNPVHLHAEEPRDEQQEKQTKPKKSEEEEGEEDFAF